MKRLLLVIILGILFMPSVASAATGRSSDTVIVPAGQNLADDLYATGRDVTVSGTVSGDAVIVGSTVTIDGTITGNLWVAAQTIRVTGSVGGSMRGIGSTATIDGKVGGDVLLGGSDLAIGKSAVIGRDVLAGGSTIKLDGRVGRDAKLGGGTATVTGAVAGNLTASTNDPLHLAAGSNVAGSVTSKARSAIDRDPSAVVGGPVTFTERQGDRKNYADRVTDSFRLYWFLASIVLLAAMLLYARRAVLAGRDVLLATPGRATLAGLGFLIAVPLIAFILMVLVLGIPLALFTLVGYALVIYTAKIFVTLLAGGAMIRLAPQTDAGFWKTFGAGVLGLTLWYLLTAVPILGGFVTLATVILGTGAQVLLGRQFYHDIRAKYGA